MRSALIVRPNPTSATSDLEWVSYDGQLRIWAGPFLMAGLNTRVVRRGNALQGWAYGRWFRYREVTGFGAAAARSPPGPRRCPGRLSSAGCCRPAGAGWPGGCP